MHSGIRIGPYEIGSSVGAGAMGQVFRAWDTRLNRDVAIKVLPKDFVADADRLRRFEQEVKTLAALNHPNVLTIHDAGVHDGAPYLVSELLEGQTLREVLEDCSGTPSALDPGCLRNISANHRADGPWIVVTVTRGYGHPRRVHISRPKPRLLEISSPDGRGARGVQRSGSKL